MQNEIRGPPHGRSVPEGRRGAVTTEEIAVKIEGHEHEIKSLKHRMDSQEEESKSIQQLVVSVERIALSTEHIMQEQVRQGQRLEKLENEPAETHKRIKTTAMTALITSIVSTVVGIAIGALLAM